ncbi:MAG: hypothetical protein IPN18_11415 [Ignavibacteriales bacterium]|nr:hypothetical protein [Ignavibacteriales bacterium]
MTKFAGLSVHDHYSALNKTMFCKLLSTGNFTPNQQFKPSPNAMDVGSPKQS